MAKFKKRKFYTDGNKQTIAAPVTIAEAVIVKSKSGNTEEVTLKDKIKEFEDKDNNLQSQINELEQQNTSQSSQIENLGQADQNLQSQIDILKQLRIERISVWKRKTIEEGKVLSVNSNQFNMKTASYWHNCLLFELRMCCFSGGGLNEPTTTYFVSRPTSGNTERIPCTCGYNAQELGVFSPTIYSDAIIIYNYTPYPIYLDEVFIWIQK